MEEALLPYQHLKIQLEEIRSATNNFDEQNRIGFGSFGKVYKGELSHSKGRSMVAIKRKHGQGIPEFLKEITMLSDYKHGNIISLLGFCCEGSEMILVYELASCGSLDSHLKSPLLTWTQRLKICLDAAKGLCYLHDPREKHQRLIHCDIKSGNILLDDQWNAKVADFGLSIIGSANEQHSVIVNVAVGTRGYCDPQFAMTHTLTKESDVYSFGVVLFEVLCGKVCITYNRNGDVVNRFVPTWIESYKQKKLNDIIFKSTHINPLDQCALETFSDIVYRCLKESREHRPKMAEVVAELETALRCQEFCERKTPFDYEEMAKTAEPPLHYSSKGELWKILSKGVLLNGGKTNAWIQNLIVINGLLRIIQGKRATRYSYLADEREDGWWMCELYQFTSDQRNLDLDILFVGFTEDASLYVEGIEFQPLEKVGHKDENQLLSDPDANWEKKLPTDYEDIIKRSKNKVQWTTKKEVYLILYQGFFINNGQVWFSLDNNGKKSYMLSAKVGFEHNPKQLSSLSLPESRFGEAAVRSRFWSLKIDRKIQSQLVSSQTTYAAYLVYKLPEVQFRYKVPLSVICGEHLDLNCRYIYLVSPQTPIIRPQADQNTHNTVNRPKIKGLSQQRNDGWMEVQFWQFETPTTPKMIHIDLHLSPCNRRMSSELIIEGVEFRPI